MSEAIIIDTNLARRDLKRIRSAVQDLKQVKLQYQKAVNNLSSLYKGDASKYLQDQINGVKIKQIDRMIGELDLAATRLNATIKDVESVNEKIKKTINSSLR